MQIVEKSLKNVFWKFWLEVGCWLILMLAVLEILARLFIFKTPPRVIDPVWGKVPVEDSCYRLGTEGFGFTCYSANGEIDTPYHDGKSIVVLGDSYTEAMQVDTAEKFVSLTEVYLRERGLEMDLHNLGDSGLNNSDYVYLAPLIIQAYSPKVVVIQINANDFRASLDTGYDNYFVEEGGKLIFYHEADDTSNIDLENLIRASGFLTYLAHRWSVISPRIVFDPPSAANIEGTDAVDGFGDSESGPVTENQIIAQVNFLKETYKDSQLVLLFIPNVPIISETGLSWSNPSDDYFVNTLQTINGVEVVYPIDSFRRLYKQNRILPRGFFNTSPNTGHINEYGHMMVAEALADSLEEILK